MKNYYAKPQLKFGEAVKLACSRIFQVKGRSRRSEFWWTQLAMLITIFVLNFIPLLGGIIATVLGLLMIPLAIRRLHDTGRSGWWWGLGFLLGFIYTFTLSNQTFRMADGNMDELAESPELMLQIMFQAMTSPLMLVLGLVYLIFSIILLVFYCQDGKPEANKYGESPKYLPTGEE